MNVNIGISGDKRDAVINILNAMLADEYVLYTKTRNYHWNVVGPQFNDLHKFFEAQYEELNDIVDEMAEQILRSLVPDDGATAAASLELLRAYTLEIGMPQDGLVIGNGSGLYANNMISPAALTYLLGHVYADFRFRSDFIASLAIMAGSAKARPPLRAGATSGAGRNSCAGRSHVSRGA